MVLEASLNRDTICKLIFSWATSDQNLGISEVYKYLCDPLLTCLLSLDTSKQSL